MKKTSLAVLLLALSACAAEPLAAGKMYPRDEAFKDIPEKFYLKGKLGVADNVDVEDKNKIFYSEFPIALQYSLSTAKIAASGKAEDGDYTIKAAIKDVKTPFCVMGTCESGSAVNYVITDKDNHVVYTEMVVVPYSLEYPLFSDDIVAMFDTFGGALGENIAHITQSLVRKTEKDFK